jgi:hypothetical protein
MKTKQKEQYIEIETYFIIYFDRRKKKEERIKLIEQFEIIFLLIIESLYKEMFFIF